MKHVYEIIDDPDSEVYLQKQQKIKEIYQELANQRNVEERKEQVIRSEEEKLKRTFFRKQAEENIKLKEAGLKSQEEIQQEEILKALAEKEKLNSIGSAPAPTGESSSNE